MMHKLNEDCYYFLTTSCTKGAACLYRHNPLALKSNVTCPAWIRGQCLDLACPLRHSNSAQRPMISNGIMCFYENLPTGCLKVDCTFIHTRPRVHLTNTSLVRSSSMNLINKEVSTPPPVAVPSSTPIESTSTTTTSVPTINETQPIVQEKPSTQQPDPSSPTRKAEIVIRRVAVNTDNDASTEKTKPPAENATSSLAKVATRSVITSSTSEEKTDETSNTTNSNRIVVNRNVGRPESVNNTSTRTIVQAVTSSRVVVTSETNASSSSSSSPTSSLKMKRSQSDVDKLIEQENETKKLKANPPSITNNATLPTSNTRLLLLATKQMATTEDKKANPLNHNRLPSTKSTNANVSVTVSISAKEQKKSTGTGLLSQDDARRTSRLERFKNKPNSPPTANNNQPQNSALPSRSVVTLTVNGLKRGASISINQNTPPAKRTLPKQELSISRSSTTVNQSVNDNKKIKPVVKTSPLKATSTKTSPNAVATAPSRPRFVPQPIRPPSPLSMNKTKSTPVMIKRPPVTIPTSFETSKTLVNDDQTTNISTESMKILNEENGDPLLKSTESNDIVDTFALIDAALIEADHLLNLI